MPNHSHGWNPWKRNGKSLAPMGLSYSRNGNTIGKPRWGLDDFLVANHGLKPMAIHGTPLRGYRTNNVEHASGLLLQAGRLRYIRCGRKKRTPKGVRFA